jgi:transposase InsO family protein
VTSDSDHRQPVAPNVLKRGFDGWNLNRGFVTNITYTSTVDSWSYPAVVTDLASRPIVGWATREQLHADLFCQALEAAY